MEYGCSWTFLTMFGGSGVVEAVSMTPSPSETLRSDVQVGVFLVEQLLSALLEDPKLLRSVDRLAPRVLAELAAWAVDVPARFNEGPPLAPLLPRQD